MEICNKINNVQLVRGRKIKKKYFMSSFLLKGFCFLQFTIFCGKVFKVAYETK